MISYAASWPRRQPASTCRGFRPPAAAPLKNRERRPRRGKKMTAKCGLNCVECPAYIATQKNDDALRAETAAKWSKMYKSELKSADLNCDGCQTDSPRLLGYCSVCGIRKCARERKHATCAACPRLLLPEARRFPRQHTRGPQDARGLAQRNQETARPVRPHFLISS